MYTGNWKQKAGLMGLGSIFTIFGMAFAIGFLPSVTAQRDNFGEIKCTELWVVDAEGRKMALLGSHEHGGVVTVYGKGGKSTATLIVDEVGGRVSTYGKGKGGAVLAGDEYGGVISIHDENGKSRGLLGIDNNGGFIQFNGKSEGKVAIGINEYGNGAVSTWDKNGYRQ